MSTAAFDAVRAIPKRTGEIRRLIASAKGVESNDEDLYNSICRASSILMAAQLEGFIKDIYRAISDDFNFNIYDFSKRPAAMQNEFCRQIAYFDGVPESEVNSRVNSLKKFFAANTVSMEFGAFPYKETPNKNPGADTVDAKFKRIGVPDVVASIAGSFFEEIFKNDSRATYKVLRECARGRAGLYRFPYRKMPPSYGFTYKVGVKSSPWRDYLESIMKRRHSIAHGDTFDNPTTWEELSRDVDKLDAFMHALAYSCCGFYFE